MVRSGVIARPDDQVLRVILGIGPKKLEEKPERRKASKVGKVRRRK